MNCIKNVVLIGIVMLLSSTTLFAQGLTVSGSVKDSQGSPMVGATVSVKGTTQGTIVDIDGRWTLSCPSGSVLVFSYVGYKVQEIIADRTQIDVILERK